MNESRGLRRLDEKEMAELQEAVRRFNAGSSNVPEVIGRLLGYLLVALILWVVIAFFVGFLLGLIVWLFELGWGVLQ